MTDRPDTRMVCCDECDGLGEWDEGAQPAGSGALEPEYLQVTCPVCEGSGRREVEVEPVDCDDDLQDEE